MDHLRHGIHLRAYAQKNPKQEYKRESFTLFEEMLNNFKHQVVGFLSKVQIKVEDAELLEQRRLEEAARQEKAQAQHQQFAGLENERNEPNEAETDNLGGMAQPFVREERKVGRNEPCPCGSGKKYKQCHGKL
jgi:preprotein translocase subunit SecA